jgi:hypothetical protein
MAQTDLADAAPVSRRWRSDLEAGKATAEIGLIFRTLREPRRRLPTSASLP